MRKVTVSLEKAQLLLATDAAKRKAHVILTWVASVVAAKQDLTVAEFEAQMATCWAFAKRTLSGVKSLLDSIREAIEGPAETPVCPEIEDDPNDMDLSALPANRRAFITSLPAHMQADVVEQIANSYERSDMPLRYLVDSDADPVLWSEIEDRQALLGENLTAAQFLDSCVCPFAMRLLAELVGVDAFEIEEVRIATQGMIDCEAMAYMREEGVSFDSYILTEINR